MPNFERLDVKLEYIGASDLFRYNENVYLVISYSWNRRKGEAPYEETLIYASDEYGHRKSSIPLKVFAKRMDTDKAMNVYIKEL